jgi:antibiotic biosynthesis monooxygenase (ABM) superfamily enzyme
MITKRSMTDEAPAKIVMERRVRPGARPSFEAWVRKLMAAASGFGGLQGSSVLTSGGTDDYFILLRFAGRDHLRRWQESAELDALLREGDAHSLSVEQSQIKTGFETWFTLPDVPAPGAAPPKWKMALVTWLALLPQVIALAFVLEPLHLPFPLGAAISTAIPVVMLTWVVMPRLTRLLYGWLYSGGEGTGWNAGT